MKNILLLSLIALTPLISNAQDSSNKEETLFAYGIYGRTIALDDEEDRHSGLSGLPVTHDVSSGFQVAAGYRWKYLGIEAVYGDFGKPAITYQDKFSVEKNVRFVGGGLHWFLWIFDLKLGWISAKGTRKFTLANNASAVAVTPMTSKISSGGGYFGLGFNFNLGSNTELVLDYTAYTFKEKPISYTINGVTQSFPTANSSETADPKDDITGAVGIFGIGFRWFL